MDPPESNLVPKKVCQANWGTNFPICSWLALPLDALQAHNLTATISQSLVNWTYMPLDCEKKPEHLCRTHTGARKTCRLHIAGWGGSANQLTTVQTTFIKIFPVSVCFTVYLNSYTFSFPANCKWFDIIRVQWEEFQILYVTHFAVFSHRLLLSEALCSRGT